jgi:hypothetical protein
LNKQMCRANTLGAKYTFYGSFVQSHALIKC